MKIIKSGVFFIAALIFFFFAKDSAFATAPSIDTFPSMVTVDTVFTVSISMNGLSGDSQYRLRLAFAQPGTSNYFGSTHNGTNFYNGTPSPMNYAIFFTATTDSSGSWSGTIEGKVESTDPNFTTGNGTYDFKVARYTASGSSPTWSSNTVSVSIDGFSPTPTPTLIPTVTPSPTSVPTVTHTPTPTRTPTPAPTSPPSSPTSKPATPTTKPTSSTFFASNEKNKTPTAVLGENINNQQTPTEKPKQASAAKTLGSSQKPNLISTIAIALGVIFLLSCGILGFRIYKERKLHTPL